jgi:hypothetical protein
MALTDEDRAFAAAGGFFAGPGLHILNHVRHGAEVAFDAVRAAARRSESATRSVPSADGLPVESTLRLGIMRPHQQSLARLVAIS